MSYAILWILTLLTSLVWVATFVACAARIKRQWIARIAVFFVMLVPFAPLAGLAVLMATLALPPFYF